MTKEQVEMGLLHLKARSFALQEEQKATFAVGT
jgi:hypothetical protein